MVVVSVHYAGALYGLGWMRCGEGCSHGLGFWYNCVSVAGAAGDCGQREGVGMSILYVVSDRQGAGKTALCASLRHLLVSQGRTAAVFKPVSSGDSDGDGGVYGALLGADTQAWGLSADAKDEIGDAVRRLDAENDVVIVEGTNSLTDVQAQGIAEAMDAKVLMVWHYHAGLSLEDMRAAAAGFGERLVGYVVNSVTQYRGRDTHSKLMPAAGGAAVFGLIPEDRCLLGVSVSQLAAHLDGELIMDDEINTDSIVEYLMVGGMSLDPGDYYYRIHDNRAAIVRGDRPDLQMSALRASGRTACIVATNGVTPIEYVRYEAELEETPIILVKSDTLVTMDRLGTLADSGGFDNVRKMERFAELLEQHVDVRGLLDEVGLSG